MKKTPVGWFSDPTHGLVAILARDDESPQDAIKRVAEDHKVDPASVTATPPAIGEGAKIAIEIPQASEARPRRAPKAPDPSENPAYAVNRFNDRASSARQMRPVDPPIIESLLPKGEGRP